MIFDLKFQEQEQNQKQTLPLILLHGDLTGLMNLDLKLQITNHKF